MNPRRKTCEHCGFENHSRMVKCVCCGKVMEIQGRLYVQKSLTPEFIKRFHKEVDEIKGRGRRK